MTSPAQNPPVTEPVSGIIRWGVAASAARTLSGPGPRLGAAEAGAAVEDIRAKAAASVEHVHRITGLEAARELRDSEVLVVDRGGWATAAVGGFRGMLEPGLGAVMAQRYPDGGAPLSLRMGGYGLGAEIGGLVALLSGHVLGQYDPFSTSPAAPGGRLLLVAPNIVQVQRQLNVDPDDFRLWVALHEQTHRVQFAAAPWLRAHLQGHVNELVQGLLALPTSLGERIKSLTGSVRSDSADAAPGPVQLPDDAASARAAAPPEAGAGFLDLVTGPRERAALSRVTAVMSLLEGHANVVMDAVDASVVPSVRTIRRRFEARGSERSALQKLLLRVIGMAAKQKQYQDGARFVRAGVDALGMRGFNVVWEAPERLPSEAELHDPAAWVARMRAAS